MERHGKKLEFWMKKRGRVMVEKPNEIPYVNLSEKRFDSHQDSVLKLGPKIFWRKA